MSDNPVPGVAALARDADIARIAAVLVEHAATIEPTLDATGHDLPAALYDAGLRPSVEPAGLDVEEQGAGLRAALLVQANKPDLTERFAEGVRFAADFVGAWLSSADDDPAKRSFLVVRPIDGAPEVRDGDLLLRRAYENGHRDGFGCGQETVAPLGIAKCEHVGG